MAPSVPTPPRVSFIPKTSLVQEDSFLERRRPRSLLVFVAIFSLVASLGSYVGLSYFEHTLALQVKDQVEQVKEAQAQFASEPKIEEARLFQAKAELARELLDKHIVVSPVLDFVSRATVSSIFYESFTFKEEQGVQVVELKGEAPSYASLAYQSDTLNKNHKGKEIDSFQISGISLTKFGSVSFTLKLVFKQGYLSYTNKARVKDALTRTAPVSTPVSSTPMQTSTGQAVQNLLFVQSTTSSSSNLIIDSGLVSTPDEMTEESSSPETEVTSGAIPSPVVVDSGVVETSQKNSFWSWFKFW